MSLIALILKFNISFVIWSLPLPYIYRHNSCCCELTKITTMLLKASQLFFSVSSITIFTVSGCHNQIKFNISISKKFLISLPSKNGLQTKFLYQLVLLLLVILVSYGHIYEAYGHINSWKPFVFDTGPIKDNSLFRHLALSKTGPNTSPRTVINSFLTSRVAKFATRGDKFVLNFKFYFFCEPFQRSPYYWF